MPKYFPGKLKPEFKAKWVAALRSGEYVQGSRTLFLPAGHLLNTRKADLYCCLGVAAKVAGMRMISESTGCGLGLPYPSDMDNYAWERVPNRIADIDSPRVKLNGRWRRLTELNDEMGKSFTEIADLIEAQL